MAVIKVKVASIIGRMDELNRVTEICGRSGIFHPDHALDFYKDTEKFTPLNEDNPFSGFLQKMYDSMNSIGQSSVLLPEEQIRRLQITAEEAADYVARFTESVGSLQERIVQTQKAMESCSQEAEDMSHFVGLNLNLDEIRECKFIKVRFGSIPKVSAELLKTTYADNPYEIGRASCRERV